MLLKLAAGTLTEILTGTLTHQENLRRSRARVRADQRGRRTLQSRSQSRWPWGEISGDLPARACSFLIGILGSVSDVDVCAVVGPAALVPDMVIADSPWRRHRLRDARPNRVQPCLVANLPPLGGGALARGVASNVAVRAVPLGLTVVQVSHIAGARSAHSGATATPPRVTDPNSRRPSRRPPPTLAGRRSCPSGCASLPPRHLV
jgi:hypothetical protein